MKGLIESAYDSREGHPDPHVFTVNIKRELLPSIYDEIMSYNMISDDVANVIIHVMNAYANMPVEIRYDSSMTDYVHSCVIQMKTNNDNMFDTVIMCMRLIMHDDTGFIMNAIHITPACSVICCSLNTLDSFLRWLSGGICEGTHENGNQHIQSY